MVTKRKALFVVVMLAVLAVLVYTVTAAPGVQVGFEIDGNTAQDDIVDEYDDWETVILGEEPDWDAGAGYLIRDGSSGPKAVIPETNIFAKGGKFYLPEEWTIEPGNTPAQNDLTNVYVYPILDDGSGNTWMIMGMERIKKQGTFDLDFEYNQTPWDGTSGTLVRSDGDVAVGFELSGNPEDPQADLEVLVLVYKPSNPTCTGWAGVYGEGWCIVFSGAGSALGPAGEATMNAVAFPQPPWGSYQSSGAPLPPGADVEPFFFAEAALNLTELGIAVGCPGFGSVHAKSRSSLEITADMKDLAGPLALPIPCRIYGHKYKDVNADGNVSNDSDSPLEGWTIELLDGVCTPEVDCRTDTTDSSGYYEFGGLSDGTYSVQEVCGAGWAQTYPAPKDGCGSGIHSGIVINLTNPDQGPYDFGNAHGSIIIRKEAKDKSAEGGVALLGGAGFTFDPNPFVGGVGTPEIFDGGAEDQAGEDGILCIDDVLLGSYQVSETDVPANYDGDPDTETVVVSSASTCADRLGDTYTPDATFTNVPLSEIEVIFRSLAGDGVTVAEITCEDEYGNVLTFDSGTDNEDETFTNLLPGTYTCKIFIDP
jgi:hypothetical protein